MTKKYGCSKDYSIIRETFQMILDNFPKNLPTTTLFEFVAFGVEDILKKAYQQNKLNCSCAYLFREKVKDEIIRRGGKI